MRRALRCWRAITRDTKVLDLARRGLRFELKREPIGPKRAPVFRGSPALMRSLTAQLQEWLELGVIEPCTAPRALHSLLFPVPKSGGRWRWVLDSRRLNEALRYRPFKMESVETVRRLVKKGDWLCSIDICDAFLHVPVSRAHRRFLAFRARGRSFQFAAMSFGTSSAPRTFTRLMKPVLATLRREGIRCSCYMDDVIVMADTKEATAAATQRARLLIESLGLTISYKKSVLIPTQRLLHLGLVFDSQRAKLFAPTEKLKALARSARRVLSLDERGSLTVRELARLSGVIISLLPALRAAWRRRHSIVRNVEFALRRSHGDWDAPVGLSRSAKSDVTFWTTTEPRRQNGQFMMPPSDDGNVLTTDASEWGFGATLHTSSGGEISISEPWSPADAARSSNWREATAIQRAFDRFSHRIRKMRCLTIRSDNSTAISILRRYGSRHKHLDLALSRLLATALRRRLEIRPQHIAGLANTVADRLSRNIATNRNEWRLSPAAMRRIRAHFGPPTVDWFASDATAQCHRFVSLLPSTRALGRDAFEFDWTSEFGLFAPPINLIHKVMMRIESTNAHGVVVVPAWPSAPWGASVPWLSSRLIYLPATAMRAASASTPLMRDGRAPRLVAFQL
jgi:hypothetical protein